MDGLRGRRVSQMDILGCHSVRARAYGVRGRTVGQVALFTSFLMACPIPTIPIAVVLDMMKNKTNKSWKYLESREGYFGQLVTIFVINFVGYKEGKLVEGGSAGAANDPKTSTSSGEYIE